MKNQFYLIVLLLCCQFSFAQSTDSPITLKPESTGTSGTGANYDMIWEKLLLRLSPDSSLYIKGRVQINFRTTQASVSTVTFDLNTAFTIDSVIYHGVKSLIATTPSASNIVTVNLGTTLGNNVYDSLYICYKGVPPLPPAGSGPQGLKKQTSNGYTYMMSVAESYQDRDWFPCKADMQDKIDSLEIKVSVPWASPTAADTFWVISNGRLMDSTIVGNNRIFTYRSNHPTASYLVCVAAGRYNHYYRNVNVNGTDVPVVYNLLIGRTPASTYNTITTALDKMNLVVAAYSQKFGDYPFKDEKHGYYDGLVGAGGIEHQTSASIASGSITSLGTLAHELAHQWFGDNVTTGTWNDLWLAEGFANYCESLVGELVPSLGINPLTVRSAFKTAALSYTANSAWIPNSNSTTSALIWGSTYSNTVYKRGAMVVSMLRAMSGDTKFFQALTNYQTTRAGKSANADTLKRFFNELLGRDITPFFNDYVGGSGPAALAVGGVGNPIITVGWNNPSGNNLDVTVVGQSKTSGSNVTYFRGPVAIRVKGSLAGQDTSIVFFDWGSNQLAFAGNGISASTSQGYLRYRLSFKPVTILYDDSSKTMSTGSIVSVGPLAVKVIDFNAHKLSTGNEIDLTLFKDEPIQKIVVLKSSDGINFTEIGDMLENGHTGQEFKYTFIDNDNLSRTVFYKAKIVSFSEDEFTKIVKIQSDVIKDISIIPNPANEFVNVSFNNSNKEKAVISIINAEGRIVVRVTTTNDNLKLNTANLPVGVYAIQFVLNNEMLETKKLLIQR